MTNLDRVLKSRDIALLTEIHIARAVLSPVVMSGCESWTTKKAERQRIDASECCAGEDAFENPLNCKEIKPVNPIENQP